MQNNARTQRIGLGMGSSLPGGLTERQSGRRVAGKTMTGTGLPSAQASPYFGRRALAAVLLLLVVMQTGLVPGDALADAVLGQSDFTSNGCGTTANTLCDPGDVVDGRSWWNPQPEHDIQGRGSIRPEVDGQAALECPN